MPELDLIVFMKCSGPNVREDNLKDSLISFAKKNINCYYGIYLTVDSVMEQAALNIFNDPNNKEFLRKEKLLDFKVSEKSWATDYNEFFDKYQDMTEWILITHDDTEFITDDYFNKIINEIKGHEDEIGWITSTSEYYYKEEGRLVTDTFRAGYHLDFDNWGAMFQLHNMAHLKNAPPEMVKQNLHLLDYPSRPVKIHGPMSAIMLISTKSMKKVGQCEDWTNYTMLIDEDWSLMALKNNLVNVWVPNVFHSHPMRRSMRPTGNKWETEAHAGFFNKWGFDVGGYTQGLSMSVEELRDTFSDTNIPWSSYRNSYDWEYLDEQ